MARDALIATALVLSVAGCNDGRAFPVAAPPPTEPATAPIPPITRIGHVTATNGGQPVGGLSMDLGGLSTVNDAGGAFSDQFRSGTTARLSMTRSGIVPRSLAFNAGATRDVNADAIDVGGFDLNYYRSLVRNGFDAPTMLEPVRRWTRTPRIYLKTVDEAGVVIDGTTLDTIEATAKDAIPRWTSGRLGVPVVKRGKKSREGQSGWITIKFPPPNATNCGRAQVGVDGGWIELVYTRVSESAFNCRVGAAVISRQAIRHEIGHALGFYHTGVTGDLMAGGPWRDPNATMSSRELAYAAMTYARPVDNTDPDVDPFSAVTLAPMHVPTPSR